jgi:AraC family transcriptional regulator, transcriptional activator of pobA
MIPVHDISEAEKKEVTLVELPATLGTLPSEPHRHQFFECFVFLKGGGTHLIDFVEFPILSNSVHIITPGQVHQVNRSADSYGFVFMFELMVFHESKNIESFLFDHSCFDVKEFAPFYHFDEDLESRLNQIMLDTWKESNSKSALRKQLVINQLSLLLLYCIQINLQRNSGKESKHDNSYAAFRRLLTAKFKTLKKVKEYAAELAISEKLLNEIVMQRTGETVSNLIYKQLILEAKRLLNTGIPAKEVAYELNFLDPAHFSKFFKAQTGLSPSEFKNIHD